MAAIIRPFGAVDDRAAFEGHHLAILERLRARAHTTNGHRQIKLDHVALSPLALDLGVAVLEFDARWGAIYGKLWRGVAAVGIAIQVAWQDLIPRPAWDANANREILFMLRPHHDSHCTVPWISRLLRQFDGVALAHIDLGLAADEEVYVDRIGRFGVDVAADGGREAHHVGRAAWRVDPLEAVVIAERFQRILIEEAVALQRDTIRKAVVEHALHHIYISAVLVQQEHAMVPDGVAVGGARLAPRAEVRQFVGRAKLLVEANRADAAGEINLSEDHVVPNGIVGGLVFGLAGERGNVRERNIEERGADAMAHGLALRDDGRLILIVGAVGGVDALARVIGFAALVNEELGALPLRIMVRLAEELDQADGEALVLGDVGLFAGAEIRGDHVRSLQGAIEHFALTRDGAVSGASLEEVPGNAHSLIGIGQARRERGHELVNAIVHIGFELGIGLLRQHVGGAFDQLGHAEVVIARHAVEAMPDGDGAVGLHARGPELIEHIHARQRDGANFVVGRAFGGLGNRIPEGERRRKHARGKQQRTAGDLAVFNRGHGHPRRAWTKCDAPPNARRAQPASRYS